MFYVFENPRNYVGSSGRMTRDIGNNALKINLTVSCSRQDEIDSPGPWQVSHKGPNQTDG